MRFVSPETTQIPLPNGEWIEVKNDLPAIEEKRYRSAGFKRLSQRKGDGDETQNDIEIDWAALAFARVAAYLVDWGVKDASGKAKKYSFDAVKQLHPDDFDVIDQAVQAHIDARAQEKKVPSGSLTGAASSSEGSPSVS